MFASGGAGADNRGARGGTTTARRRRSTSTGQHPLLNSLAYTAMACTFLAVISLAYASIMQGMHGVVVEALWGGAGLATALVVAGVAFTIGVKVKPFILAAVLSPIFVGVAMISAGTQLHHDHDGHEWRRTWVAVSALAVVAALTVAILADSTTWKAQGKLL